MKYTTKNKWYNEYRELADENPKMLGKRMWQALDRVADLLDRYDFDEKAVQTRIDFVENEIHCTKGSSDLMKLELCQKFWFSCWYGIKKSDGSRLLRICPLVMGRGDGKSAIAGCCGIMATVLDGENGGEVHCLANTRTQAGIVFDSIKNMTTFKDSVLYKLEKRKLLRRTKVGLRYEPTNSVIDIMANDYDGLDGYNSSCAIIDELHASDRDIVTILDNGSSRKRKQYQIFCITTNGTKRGKAFDENYKMWTDVLDGELDDDTILPFIYQLDNIKEVKDSDCWIKAMPMLGVLISPEVIAKDMARASNNPVMQAEILSKTFNIPQNDSFAYFSAEESKGSCDLFDESLFKGRPDAKVPVVLGIDLSNLNDIASCAMIRKHEGKLYVKWINFCPRHIVENLPPKHQSIYYMNETKNGGNMVLHSNYSNDRQFMFDYISAFIDDNHLAVAGIGFDNWSAGELMKMFEGRFGIGITDSIIQGFKTFSPRMKEIKEMIGAGDIIFEPSSLIQFCVGNVVVDIDKNENIYPNKSKASSKIDPFMAFADAYIYLNRYSDQLLLDVNANPYAFMEWLK